MTGIEPLIAAVAGGVLPALAWLWFWRREDAVHPEPRKLIALAFLAGMGTVGVVIPIERFVQPFLSNLGTSGLIFSGQTLVFTAWSFIEEIMKFLAARWTVLKRRENDEPIDPVIYMVTVALGFAAAENTLFLLSPIGGDTMVQTFITGNLRFIGATLLHVLSSAVIGVALALSFYASKRIKRRYMFYGVILACLLHSAFNFFILNTAEASLFRTFSFVWLGVIALLAVLEYVKRIHPRWRR